MTEKRFVYYEHKGADYILDTPNNSLDFIEMLGDCLEAEEIVDLLNQLSDENEQLKQGLNDDLELIGQLQEENKQLKQYKQSVNDVLKSWSQKNVTAKQLQVVLEIMKELNVIGDVE